MYLRQALATVQNHRRPPKPNATAVKCLGCGAMVNRYFVANGLCAWCRRPK